MAAGKSNAGDSRTRRASRAQRYWAVGTIWLALTLSVLDGSIANVAWPTIAADLHSPAADSVWVVNAYQLAIVVCRCFARLLRWQGKSRDLKSRSTAAFCASLGSPLVESMVISSARIILGLVTGDREFFARGVAHGRRQLSWLYWSYSFAALS
jgi:MFS transporter, DHA2 family, multidrug resistance protein